MLQYTQGSYPFSFTVSQKAMELRVNCSPVTPSVRAESFMMLSGSNTIGIFNSSGEVTPAFSKMSNTYSASSTASFSLMACEKKYTPTSSPADRAFFMLSTAFESSLRLPVP